MPIPRGGKKTSLIKGGGISKKTFIGEKDQYLAEENQPKC
jgi:hypothetical protein